MEVSGETCDEATSLLILPPAERGRLNLGVLIYVISKLHVA
jgi:hypothetical protein